MFCFILRLPKPEDHNFSINDRVDAVFRGLELLAGGFQRFAKRIN